MNKLIGIEDFRYLAFGALATIILLGLYVLLALQPHYVANGTQCLSNLKQIANATFAYASDNDERLPPASSMSTMRALLMSYVPNKTPLIGISGFTNDPGFNFSAVGVNTNFPPYPGTTQVEPNEVALWYALPLSSARGPFVARGDSSVKSMRKDKLEEFYKLFAPQFDRKSAKLFPPDYLADKDPLK